MDGIKEEQLENIKAPKTMVANYEYIEPECEQVKEENEEKDVDVKQISHPDCNCRTPDQTKIKIQSNQKSGEAL